MGYGLTLIKQKHCTVGHAFERYLVDLGRDVAYLVIWQQLGLLCTNGKDDDRNSEGLPSSRLRGTALFTWIT